MFVNHHYPNAVIALFLSITALMGCSSNANAGKDQPDMTVSMVDQAFNNRIAKERPEGIKEVTGKIVSCTLVSKERGNKNSSLWKPAIYIVRVLVTRGSLPVSKAAIRIDIKCASNSVADEPNSEGNYLPITGWIGSEAVLLFDEKERFYGVQRIEVND